MDGGLRLYGSVFAMHGQSTGFLPGHGEGKQRRMKTYSWLHIVVFSKKERRKEYVWWRRGMVWGKGMPLQAHGEASLTPLRYQPHNGIV